MNIDILVDSQLSITFLVETLNLPVDISQLISQLLDLDYGWGRFLLYLPRRLERFVLSVHLSPQRLKLGLLNLHLFVLFPNLRISRLDLRICCLSRLLLALSLHSLLLPLFLQTGHFLLCLVCSFI